MFDTLFAGNGLTLMGISFAFTLLIGFVLAMWVRALKNRDEKSYEQQLQDLLEDDILAEDKKPDGLIDRWSKLWGNLFEQMGWERYDEDPKKAGKDVAIGALVIAFLGSAVTLNPFIGPVLAAVILTSVYMVCKNIATKKSDAISDQLPGFLFALKANIQANETPERAVLKVINAMPSPLYEDLLIVRNHILSNSTFKEALEDLKLRTANRDLKFLASCMIQATASGANLEPQIETIQSVLDARREVTDEINKAARSASPAIWASSIAIPGAFIAIFFGDPNAANFWFVNPISWAFLAVIAGLWGLGVWLARRMVSSIRNI